MEKNVKVCSLFSGIGGIDIGFVQAGYAVAWANEIDKYAANNYKTNLPECSCIQKNERFRKHEHERNNNYYINYQS